MHHTAKQRVHAQFERLSEPHVGCQELCTLGRGVVLLVAALAILIVRLTDAFGKNITQRSHRGIRRGGVQHRCCSIHDRAEEVGKPAEGGVVLRQLAAGVERQPGLDFNGPELLRGREPGDVELGDDGAGHDVADASEAGEVVGLREAEQGDGIRGIGAGTRNPQAVEVFGVEGATGEGAGHVDTAMDLEDVEFDGN